MTKVLSIHEKINIRAWLARCKTAFIPKDVLIRLPVPMLPKLVYAITGNSVGKLAYIQPPVIRPQA